MKRRVVITGMGLISPLGHTVAENWETVLAGRSGIGPITRFDSSNIPTHFAGEVKNFDPSKYLDVKEARRFDLFIQYAVAASVEAMEMAGLSQLEGEDAERTGVIVGAGIGGLPGIQENHTTLTTKGARRVSPFFIPGSIINMAGGVIAMRYGALGPNYGTVSACSSAGHAMADAFHSIQRGDSDIMITGGCESTMTELAFAGFSSARTLSTRNEEPEKASRPFDKDRDGFVLSEGAGILIFEEYEHAVARGATIYGEVIGAGMSGDAYHITSPHPEGRGAALAMKAALRSAGIEPTEVGYVNAHATSTDVGDPMETQAIKQVFGEHAYKLAVSSTKSMHGHLLGAAGAIEAIITVLALKEQVLPPTINLENPDEGCDLDYIPNVARPVSGVEVAVSNSFGFGGTNVTMAFRRI